MEHLKILGELKEELTLAAEKLMIAHGNLVELEQEGRENILHMKFRAAKKQLKQEIEHEKNIKKYVEEGFNHLASAFRIYNKSKGVLKNQLSSMPDFINLRKYMIDLWKEYKRDPLKNLSLQELKMEISEIFIEKTTLARNTAQRLVGTSNVGFFSSVKRLARS